MHLVRNRFESVVIEKVRAESANWPALSQNPDLQADAVCIALNALPPHYIRYDVDLSFFLSEEKRAQEDVQVNAAVDSAVAQVQRSKKP